MLDFFWGAASLKPRAILLMEADFNLMNKEVYGVCMLDVVRTRPQPVCTCSNNSVDWAASANINSCK